MVPAAVDGRVPVVPIVPGRLKTVVEFDHLEHLEPLERLERSYLSMNPQKRKNFGGIENAV